MWVYWDILGNRFYYNQYTPNITNIPVSCITVLRNYWVYWYSITMYYCTTVKKCCDRDIDFDIMEINNRFIYRYPGVKVLHRCGKNMFCIQKMIYTYGDFF